jgi:hypothetical protein
MNFATAKIGDEMYEHLRQILERQNGRSYTFEEAKEIGDGLIDFLSYFWSLEKGELEIS